MSAAPSDALTLSWHKKSADSFARILRRIAAHAQSLGGDARYSTEQAIHELRLLIKRVRALLWFARPSLAKTVELEAKTQLRKASHLLSGHRDTKAAQTTFEKILQDAASPRAREAVEETSRVLRERDGHPDSKESIERAVKVLCQEIDEFAGAVERSAKWPSAAKRTEKAFRTMRRTGKKARRSRADADFHAWRKKTKRLLFLLELGENAPSGREKQLRENVDKLQSTLGDDHDCVVTAHQMPARHRNSLRTVSKLLGERKRRLRKKSRKLARRIEEVV